MSVRSITHSGGTTVPPCHSYPVCCMTLLMSMIFYYFNCLYALLHFDLIFRAENSVHTCEIVYLWTEYLQDILCLQGCSSNNICLLKSRKRDSIKPLPHPLCSRLLYLHKRVRVCLRVPLCVQQHSPCKEPAWPLNSKYTQCRRNQTEAEQTRPLFE